MFGYKNTIQKRNDRVTYPKTKANVTNLLSIRQIWALTYRFIMCGFNLARERDVVVLSNRRNKHG